MKKSFIYLALGLTCCTLLTACGGSSPPPVVATPTPPPVVLNVDQRVDSALAVSEATAESAEPEVIDTATLTEPEDSEPKGV